MKRTFTNKDDGDKKNTGEQPTKRHNSKDDNDSGEVVGRRRITTIAAGEGTTDTNPNSPTTTARTAPGILSREAISSDRKTLDGSTSREDDDDHDDHDEDHDGGAAIDVPSSIPSIVGTIPGSATAARGDDDSDRTTTDMGTITSAAPTMMSVTGTTATTTAAVFDLLTTEDGRLALHVLSFVSIKDLARSRCVSLKFNNLCERSIVKYSKKAFQTNEELRGAVMMYCTGDKSQKNRVHCIYGGFINTWDVSQITDFSLIFDGMGDFNESIGGWDVSNATNIRFMFYYASSFNQPLDSWDTSKVTNMHCLFFGASVFNQPLSRWNTSKVTNMSCMFFCATSFNQPLESWDTSKVTDMTSMFSSASSFNQPLDNWDTGSVSHPINYVTVGTHAIPPT